jgi:putative ABC transport system permease protein
MTGLAWASVRHRGGGFVASFVALFLGATILMAFASMLDTAAGSSVSTNDKTVLTIMASVVGGWGAIIVASAIMTTLSVAARQRARELALLRSVGATPGQVVRLIIGEVALVGLAAVVLAVPAGFGGGYVLLRRFRDTGQVDSSIQFRFGVDAFGAGVVGCLLVALSATWLTARRTTRRRVQDALLDAAAGGRRMSRLRLISGLVLVAGGINCAVLTAKVMDGAKLQTQSVAAEGAILSALGLALLAPVILRAVLAVAAPLLRGSTAQLAVTGIRQRIQQAATPLMPIIVCTAIATGTLYMQSTWNLAHHGSSADDKSTETLNYVVVGMIAVFAAVMLINLLVANLTNRRREFAQLRLVGSTPGQVVRLVSIESVVLLIVGLLFGSLAALLTVVPYSMAVNHTMLPDTSIAAYGAVVAGVVVLTLLSSVSAARRSNRVPAIDVISSAAT